MRSASILALAAVLLAACASTPSRLRVSDVVQVRLVAPDDPLAAKFDAPDGQEIRLGDPILTDRSIDRCLVKKINDTQYDLIVTLSDQGKPRWRPLMEKKREVALLIGGKVRSLFTANAFEENKAMKFTVAQIAQSEPEANAIQMELDRKSVIR